MSRTHSGARGPGALARVQSGGGAAIAARAGMTGRTMAKRTKKVSGRRRAAGGRGRHASLEELAESLPSVEGLRDVPSFGDLCIDEVQRAAFEELCERVRLAGEDAAEMRLGFVVRLDRGFPLVATEESTFRAEHSVTFAKQDKEKGDGLLPAVGDCVAVRVAPGHDMGVIECVLPRRTAFERWRGRNRGERQVLAANIDEVLIVAALGAGEILLDRIARSLVLANDCGAAPVVVLTKSDRCSASEVDRDLERVRRLVGASVRVIVTSSVEGGGLAEVRAAVPEGSCAMILGESGAGKSTLLNALLGYEALATSAVRERDDAGRHTTVARVMVALPGACGVIVDAPGLRSLPLVGHERGLALTFPEIVEASRGCRFNDCTHTHEPGCAVLSAIDDGAVDEERLEAFLALAKEMRVSARSLDPDVHL